MNALIFKTVDGIQVQVEEETTNIRRFFSNLGGIDRDDHFFFWASDAQWVPETLENEGYSITYAEQSPA